MVLFLSGCGRPPLRISQQRDVIVLDMQSLGEYPTDVTRVRLTDAATQRVVWEVVGSNDPQLGRIELRAGANPVTIEDVRHGTYRATVPAGPVFTLARGRSYVVEVWGRRRWPARATLTIPI